MKKKKNSFVLFVEEKMIIANDLNDQNYQIANQMNNENSLANNNDNGNSNNLDEIHHLQQEPQYEIIICTNNELKRKFTNEDNLCENLNENFHIEYQCHQINTDCCKELPNHQQSDANFEKCENHYVNENNFHNHTHLVNSQNQIANSYNGEMHQQHHSSHHQQQQQELSYINLTVMHHPHLESEPNHHHQNHMEKSIQTSIYSMESYPITCNSSSSPLFTIAPSNCTTWTHQQQPGQIQIQSAVNSSSINSNHLNSRSDTSSQTIINKNQTKSNNNYQSGN